MARTSGSKTETPQDLLAIADLTDLPDSSDTPDDSPTSPAEPPAVRDLAPATQTTDMQDIDEILNSLKALLSAVEKLQKVRQDVGDIKPLVVRMLDGELVSGEELEQLKTGVNGLSRLIRAYSDHQIALAKAQPARGLLDDVLKVRSS